MASNSNETTYAPAVGIDLGTTYSAVSYWNPSTNRVDVIANEFGERTTPSVVAFTDQERLVGAAAQNQAHKNPENTIYDAKRLIGRPFSDPNIQKMRSNWPFEVKNVDEKPVIEVEYKGERKQFTPQEISAAVLIKMKSTAEEFFGKPVKDAVITVPAYFDNSQRQATKDAATIAGLNVLRIINEPTAAALAYGLDKNNKEEQNIIIVDCGGGTTDLSLLCLEDGCFEVKATNGNCFLGGIDLDHRLLDHCVNDFRRKHKLDLTKNPRALRRLKTACEKAKRTLTSRAQVDIDVESLLDGQDFNLTITRARFEELCMDLFAAVLKPIEQVLIDAKIDKRSVDEIVLVGGTTRIPKIQSMLRDFFNGKELCKSINPDEAVTYGAAIQAAILTRVQDTRLDEMVLLDVTPLSLGLAVQGTVMNVLIPRNTAIPVHKSETYSTAVDNQPGVTISVYEGERKLVKDNNQLGQFDLIGIPPAPRGTPQIEVSFDVDTDGILKVTAKDKNTGKSNDIIIKNQAGRLSDDQIKKMIADAEAHKAEDEELMRRHKAKNDLESVVYGAKNQLGDKAPENVTEKINDTLSWMERNQQASLEEYDEKKQEFMKFMESHLPQGNAFPGIPDTANNYMDDVQSFAPQSKGPVVEDLD